MKLLVLLLAAASLAVTPSPVLAPGQGDAAAAVAAHNKGVPIQAPGTQNGSLVLLLTGSAKVSHVDGGPVAGQSVFHTTVKTGDALACIQHDAAHLDCNPGTIPENDADPGTYLFIDTLTSWRLADNPAGTDAATLTGLVDSKGGFQMAGDFVFPGAADGSAHTTHIYLTGKAKFDKGTLTINKVSGKFTAVSDSLQHYAAGSFKSTPAAN